MGFLSNTALIAGVKRHGCYQFKNHILKGAPLQSPHLSLFLVLRLLQVLLFHLARMARLRRRINNFSFLLICPPPPLHESLSLQGGLSILPLRSEHSRNLSVDEKSDAFPTAPPHSPFRSDDSPRLSELRMCDCKPTSACSVRTREAVSGRMGVWPATSIYYCPPALCSCLALRALSLSLPRQSSFVV